MLDLTSPNSEATKKRVKEGTWHTYPQDEEVEIRIRPLLPKTVNKINSRHERYRRGRKEVDEDKVARDLQFHAVADWKGMTDSEGKLQPANKQNVHTVFDNFTELGTWIMDTAMDEGKAIEEMAGERAENFTPTSAP